MAEYLDASDISDLTKKYQGDYILNLIDLKDRVYSVLIYNLELVRKGRLCTFSLYLAACAYSMKDWSIHPLLTL